MNGEGTKLPNGSAIHVRMNNNNQKGWNSTTNTRQPSLIEDIASLMPKIEQNELMNTANKLLVSIPPSYSGQTATGVCLSPKSPTPQLSIMSFEEPDDEPKVTDDDVYLREEKEEKKAHIQTPRMSLAAPSSPFLHAKLRQPRGSLPDITPAHKASSPPSETISNAKARRSKFGWPKKGKNKVISTRSISFLFNYGQNYLLQINVTLEDIQISFKLCNIWLM